MGRKKRYRGHFCWACGRIRANERFSGKGHVRHICRDCQKLGNEELAYRQEIRNVDRCLTVTGDFRRSQHKTFERFLMHTNPRVRAYAQRIKDEMDAERRAWRETLAEEERLADECEKASDVDTEDMKPEIRGLDTEEISF